MSLSNINDGRFDRKRFAAEIGDCLWDGAKRHVRGTDEQTCEGEDSANAPSAG
jgi:hypothetical protein